MIRTLIVEDDSTAAEVHRSYVERVPGFCVTAVAHRATEALDLLASEPVDLVLLDLYLPDAHGLDLLRMVRARTARPVDVIAVTAARDAQTLRRAVAHGVAQYLVKPFAFATFADKLERYARYRDELRRDTEHDQAGVDALLGTLRDPAKVPLPKGLSEPTLALVRDTVREAGAALTAAQVGERCGLARVTARRYLEHLARHDRVAVSLRYGRTGRPEHRYGWEA